MFRNTELKEMISGKTLSDEDTRVLIRAYQNGYTGALDPLIHGYAKMILKSIPSYVRMTDSVEDWFHDGVVTLVLSANHFNPDAETRFTTYLWHALRNNQTRSKKLFHLPIYMWKYMTKYRMLKEEYPDITDQDMAELMNISISFLETLTSADAFIQSNNLVDYSAIPTSAYSEDASVSAIKNVDLDYVNEAIQSLFDERIVDILKMRYGYYGQDYTLEEIGKKYGISRQGIDQLIKRSLVKLRENRKLYELCEEYVYE